MNDRILRSERGMALVTAIIAAAVLITIAGASLIYSRSDVMVSDNVKHGSRALWIAQLGAERARNFLRTDGAWKGVTATPVPVAASGSTYSGLANSTYATTVARYGGNKFLIDSSASAPDGSSVRIQEVVALPAVDLDWAAINLHGTGTHTKLVEPNLAVPAWYIDARNHDRHGQPILSGPSQFIRPGLRGTTESVSDPTNPTAVRRELCDLRNAMITEGNTCNAQGTGQCNGEKNGSNGNGAGRYFVKSLGLSTCDCNADLLCNETTLDLSDPRINAIDHANGQPPSAPTHSDTSWTDDPAGTPSANPAWYLGPLVANPPTQIMSPAQATELQRNIELLLEFALHSNVRDRRAITADITNDTTTGASGTSSDPNRYGTWDNPVIAVLCDPSHLNPKMARLSQEPPCNGQSAPSTTQIKTSSARVAGTGVLIIGRTIDIGNQAQFSWRGIVLVLDAGRVYATNINGNEEACGMVLGTIVLQVDSSGNSPKLRLADAQHKNCANYFAAEPTPATALPTELATIHGIGVKYSQESIDNALAAGLTTLAWREVYAGEQ
ncbi:MAG: hypothetical protein ACREQQ_02835 [Candidatus Binatia bacterium]